MPHIKIKYLAYHDTAKYLFIYIFTNGALLFCALLCVHAWIQAFYFISSSADNLGDTRVHSERLSCHWTRRYDAAGGQGCDMQQQCSTAS